MGLRPSLDGPKHECQGPRTGLYTFERSLYGPRRGGQRPEHDLDGPGQGARVPSLASMDLGPSARELAPLPRA